jgi:rhodanese-related sulfurtransferase
MDIPTITPNQLSQHLNSGQAIELIDVRTPAEFREVHATDALNIPLDKLVPSEVARTRHAPTEPLYVICKSGARGRQACEKLVAAGCTNVINVEGGMTAWEQASLPVVRGRKTISLERQVRIAAGLLVVTGVVLSFVHPLFVGLSAFVGAGLVFAGITDTCAMGLLIAKMPWNQVRE